MPHLVKVNPNNVIHRDGYKIQYGANLTGPMPDVTEGSFASATILYDDVASDREGEIWD